MPKSESPGESGTKRQDLSQGESDELNTSYERGLEDTRTLDTRVLIEKVNEYRQEIQFAAGVAREELAGQFDGQSPESGNFGIDRIHPGYFGFNDWDSLGSASGQGTANWLDQDTPDNISGSTGLSNPLEIGDTVVHIILGIQSYQSDPAITRVKFQKNDQPLPAVNTEEEFRNTDMRVKWLDSPLLLQPNDTLAAEVYVGGESGSTYNLTPALFGLSFLEARKYRILDPANMAGTSDDDIVVD